MVENLLVSSPLTDPAPQYGNTYIAKVLSGSHQGLALAVTVSGKSRLCIGPKRKSFAGFRAGYLDLWENRKGLPADETAVDGVAIEDKTGLVKFIDGAELEWLEGKSLDDAIDLFGRY